MRQCSGYDIMRMIIIPDIVMVSPDFSSTSTQSSVESLIKIRHTCAHVMAMAVQTLFPETKVTIGPATESGFYYDFDREGAFTPHDLTRIESEMRRLMKLNLPIVREVVNRSEIRAEIERLNEPYKLEILDRIEANQVITRYTIGTAESKEFWWDLCAGPHLQSTGSIDRKAFALESVAGAYWRGDEKNPQLQRIYGTAWETAEDLKAYLTQKEEAKRRDHRKLGQDLDLFSIQEEAGGGLVFWQGYFILDSRWGWV